MLGHLGVSTLHSIKTMTQFFFYFEHQTSHAACFNARGLLYECIFDTLLFFRHTDLLGNPFLITSLLDLLFLPFVCWIIILAIQPATMLGYYSMSASLMPSKFFHRRFNLLEVCVL
jgi:hypothetical protein